MRTGPGWDGGRGASGAGAATARGLTGLPSVGRGGLESGVLMRGLLGFFGSSDYLGRKVNQFQVRFALRDSRPLSVAFLKMTIKILVETDYQIKTGTLDKDYLFDLALLKIASNR